MVTGRMEFHADGDGECSAEDLPQATAPRVENRGRRQDSFGQSQFGQSQFGQSQPNRSPGPEDLVPKSKGVALTRNDAVPMRRPPGLWTTPRVARLRPGGLPPNDSGFPSEHRFQTSPTPPRHW